MVRRSICTRTPTWTIGDGSFHNRRGIGQGRLMARVRERVGTGVCNCRHMAEAHEVLFQTIYAIKRGRCTVAGCACEGYTRNPNYRVVSQ